jgi:hypothetical protein
MNNRLIPPPKFDWKDISLNKGKNVMTMEIYEGSTNPSTHIEE